jgi:hypothetical protein
MKINIPERQQASFAPAAGGSPSPVGGILRLLIMLGMIILAVPLRPARAAGQEAAPAAQRVAAMQPRIDPRLLVAAEDRRAALDRTEQRRVDLEGWNLYDAMDYMAWGILPGAVIGALYAGATADAGLEGPGVIMMGAVMGTAVGMAAGGIIYSIRVL